MVHICIIDKGRIVELFLHGKKLLTAITQLKSISQVSTTTAICWLLIYHAWKYYFFERSGWTKYKYLMGKMCHITINFYNFTPLFTAVLKYPLNWTGRRTFLSKFQYGDNFQTIISLSPILIWGRSTRFFI